MNHEQQPTQEPAPDEPETAATPETGQAVHPEIWIGSLADYNNGDLHGAWIDAAREPSEIHTDIQRILASGPAAARGEAPEEWGIFDHEGFGPIEIGEYESIDRVAQLARAIADYGPAYAAWAAPDATGDINTDRFEQAYLGQFDSLAAFAALFAKDFGIERLLDETIPPSIRSYVRFDTDQFGRDLQLGGDISTAPAGNGTIYIFRNF